MVVGNVEKTDFNKALIKRGFEIENPKKVKEFVSKKSKAGNNCVFTTSLNVVKEVSGVRISTNHAYTVSKVTKDTVYLVDPYDSSKEIPYPKSEFMKDCGRMSFTEL